MPERPTLPRLRAAVHDCRACELWAGAQGKRRIHQRPEAAHLTTCRPWLDAELAAVRPRAIVCMGATAAFDAFARDLTAVAALPRA